MNKFTDRSFADVALRHQLKIARQTLRYHDVMIAMLGGMTRAEAVETLRRYGTPTDRALAAQEVAR